MSIVLTRIDSRLIHGQVLEAWVPFTQANCIVVANDQVAGAMMQRLMMEASVPKRIRVVIGTVEEVAALFRQGDFASRRVLLLFGNSEDALRAYRNGVDFADLNLGNMHATEGKLRFSCTISLDAEDVENLNLLDQAGVRIVSRCVPNDLGKRWRKLVRNWEGGDAS